MIRKFDPFRNKECICIYYLLKSCMHIIDLFLFSFTFIMINCTILSVLKQIAFYKKQTFNSKKRKIV